VLVWRRLLRVGLVAALALCWAAISYGGVGVVVRHEALTLPEPVGPYRVGRVYYQFDDAGRIDPLAPAPGPRRLPVSVWYPTLDPAGPAAPYLPAGWAEGRSDPFWGGFVQDPARVRAHAMAGAALATGPSRMLVMEPGLGLSAPDYAALAEDLASRGFVIVGVTPTYSANVAVLDGHLVAATAAGGEPGDALVRVWADDARFVVGQVARQSLFTGRLDPDHVGYFGHSFGGAASANACAVDGRCVGSADIDGQPFGAVISTGLTRPFLMVGSDGLCTDPGCPDMPGLQSMVRHSAGPTAAYSVVGARHFNFCDLALYHVAPPLRWLLPLGPTDPARALRTTADLMDAFFGNAFRGDPVSAVSLNDVADRTGQARVVTI
jgi:hypothetical protein